MRKLVTKSANGASLPADFDEALRVVQLRGLSGDAKRAASMTLWQPAFQDTQRIGSNLQPVNHKHGMVYSFSPLLRQKATTRPPQSSCRPAHKTAHQLAFQAFTDWQWMRGHTLPGHAWIRPRRQLHFFSPTLLPAIFTVYLFWRRALSSRSTQSGYNMST